MEEKSDENIRADAIQLFLVQTANGELITGLMQIRLENLSGISSSCITEITLNLIHRKNKNKAYSTQLKNKSYCAKLKDIITEIEKDKSINSFCSKWEYVKYKNREFSIKFSKELKKERNLLSEINQCCSKPDLTNEDKEKLLLW